jgi:hypothetical protein
MEIEIPLTESEIEVVEVEEFPAGISLTKLQSDSSAKDGPRYEIQISGDRSGPHRFRTASVFDSERHARLWIDVWFDIGGFYEKKTGERGVPPAIATAGTDTAMSYLVTQFGTDEVVEYCNISEASPRSACRVRRQYRRFRVAQRPEGFTTCATPIGPTTAPHDPLSFREPVISGSKAS